MMTRRNFIRLLGMSAGGTWFVPRVFPGWHTDQDETLRILRDVFAFADSASLHARPIGDVIVALGGFFVGTEYVGGTLEQPEEESLVVCLDGFDCVTLCETLLALGRCVKLRRQTMEEYRRQLQSVRYRDGIIDGYPSRLHYFSDWIHDNAGRGLVEEITRLLGGRALDTPIHFMSSHWESYSKLNSHPDLIARLKEQEADISRRSRIYIPKSELKGKERYIRNGDILAFTSAKAGLDVAHTGIAVRQGNEIRLLHAPQAGERVQVTNERVSVWLSRRRQMTGVMAARPIEP